ncbi:hypothetical protein R50073_17870 [Maricurvus nonylphenolicus]|uniref:hypothetical protein n=1 Tax=Maricurvus nonylphenolicus TaxID=1008307 RepID=UPI0036F21388
MLLIMRKPLILLLLATCSSIAFSQGVKVFDSQATLALSCNLTLVLAGTSELYTPKFSKIGDCRIVTQADTDIPSTHYINGMYVFFIENNITSENRCYSEYTAVGITNANELYTTDRVKRSGSCNASKEQHEFEYFAEKLTAASI